jgi:uncharacterized BrkB/YihY/UPF0761 family membrane protein
MKNFKQKLALLALPLFWLAPLLVKAEELTNPLTGNSTPISIETLASRLIKGALGLVGVISLLMFIYGGFLWLISAGDSEKVKKGKDIMIWSVLGIVIIFASYAILSMFFALLSPGSADTGATNPGSATQ